MSLTGFISQRFNARDSLPKSIRAMQGVSITGIAIAVAALVIATSVGRGFENRYRKALIDFNAHIIVMSEVGEMAGADQIAERMNDIEKGEIAAMTPFLYRETLSVGGGKIRGLVVKGVDPATMSGVNPMSLNFFGDAGTLKEALSVKEKNIFSVVAGRALAGEIGSLSEPFKLKLLLPNETSSKNSAGDFKEVKVSGLFESGMHEYDAQFILMSLGDVRKLFQVDADTITGLELKLNNPDKADAVAEKINEELGPKYRAVTWSELNHDLLAAVKLERLVAALIMGIMVVVAALNIVAVLVLMTIYRFHEISVLKALGVKNRIIRNLLVRGGFFVGFIGVLAGLILGISISWGMGRFALIPLPAEIYLINSLPIDISPTICGMVALFCLGIGFLTSLMAARRLAQISVVEGLQMAR